MKVAIIGAGGHGRSVYDCLRRIYGTEHEIVFFDDGVNASSSQVFDCRVVVPVRALEKDDSFTHAFVAIGENRRRREIACEVIHSNRKPLKLIHPWTAISPYAEIGEGTIAVAGTVVNAASVIGEQVILNTHCSVGHDCQIEDFAQIASGVNLGGGAIVRTGAFLGIGAKVAPGVTIGAWSVIGAGSVVLQDIPQGCFAYGMPARPAQKRENAD